MASGANGLQRLSPWHILLSRIAENRQISLVDMFNLLEDTPGMRVTFRHPGPFASPMRFLVEDDDDFGGFGGGSSDTRMRDWLVSRSLELDDKYMEPIDVNAVLSKCRKEVYSPKPAQGGKGKAEADQNECPVCLEKFVAKDELLSLPCNHKFHASCLIPWVKSNHALCPCCRADIRGGGKKEAPPRMGYGSSGRSSQPNNTARPGSSDSVRNVPIMRERYPASNNSNNYNAGPGSSDSVRNVPIMRGRYPASNNSNNYNAAGSARRGPEDIMTILAQMEAALDRFGLRG